MPSERFWRLTLWEWMRVLIGYKRRQTEYWRMVRQLLALTYNINVEKKDRLTPEELMPLMGDAKPSEKAYIPPDVFIGILNQTFGN